MNKFLLYSLSIAAVSMSLTQIANSSIISECNVVINTLELNSDICNGQFSSSAHKSIQSVEMDQNTELQKLGIILRRLGYLDVSEQVLQKALLNDPGNTQIQLSLANIARAKYLMAAVTFQTTLDTSSRSESIESGYLAAQKALHLYEVLFGSLSRSNEIKAALNWLRLWSELKSDIPMIQELRYKTQYRFTALAKHLIDSSISLDNSEELEGRIYLLETLSSIPTLSPDLYKLALDRTETLIPLLQKSDKIRSFSRVLGIHALLMQSVGNLDQAISDLNQANNITLSIRALDLTYRWEHNLGKLYVLKKDLNRAKIAYIASINNIATIRDGSLSLNQEKQYNYFDQVEPVYREYLSFLLNEQQPDLKSIIHVNEKLRLGEIENYLQCGNLKATSLLDLPASQLPDATLYLVRGVDRYEVILHLKDGSMRRHSVSVVVVNENIKQLRKILSDTSFRNTSINNFKDQFGVLYTTILKPLEKWLPKSGTIVFAVDSRLQNIPWAALYDGHQFLIGRMSVAFSYGLEFRTPQLLSKDRLKIIAGGVSAEIPNAGKSFDQLPRVPEELGYIKSLFPNSKILLNSQFTRNNLEKQSADFPIVHLASHAKFSSDPDETYILDWNGKVPLSQLERLIKARTLAPIELLVLSACETAKSDDRATLGIAGTAVRAGARSTIAMLWNTRDNQSPEFMKDFYTSLKKGKTKAEALRDAQINVIHSANGKFGDWANAVLFGSWL
jgi:CHAT domain-containing protein